MRCMGISSGAELMDIGDVEEAVVSIDVGMVFMAGMPGIGGDLVELSRTGLW